MVGTLSAELLGSLRIAARDRVLGPRDLGGRRPRQVLEILLVHQGQPVPKDRIADLLWGERLPCDPMRTLEAHVSTLRARLAPAVGDPRTVLRSESKAYRLDSDRVDTDLRRFDALLASAAASPLGERIDLRRRALGLVRGELLADEPYAEWAFALRDLYTERALQLRLDLAEDCMEAGLPEETVQLAQQVLAAQPARERAHRLLIAGRYVAGDQDLALQAYDRCRRILDSEFGVRPLAETERAYLAVLDRTPADTVVRRTRTGPAAPPRPETRFAHGGDATIAYQVLGDGPQDVVFAHAWFSHMEIGWEEPRYAAFLRRLARDRRLIVFDRRGMGMSDPAPPTVTVEERADDIRAVMDAAGSSRAVLVGSCGSGPTTIALAARAPERVNGLVLFGTFARMLATRDYPAGWSREFFREYKAGLEQGWTTGRGICRSVPSAGPDEALMEWLGRLLRLSAAPAAARAILDFAATIDVRDLLDHVDAPTLVLHRRADQWVHPDNGRYLAAHIPGARFVDLDGADHWPWFGDSESVLRPVEAFLDALRPRSRGFPEGRSATLLP
ncbi:alpha/beta fold hydrolase [Pseudonocardia sp.]|uniref:alpha/beta fold hydrolase n=1 Tax=Pseudonocardia sp. TaxID=60912 RepID=UPI003D135F7F